MATCAVCGMTAEESRSPSLEYAGERYYFMSGMHRLIFSVYPELFLNRDDNSFGDRRTIDMDPHLEE